MSYDRPWTSCAPYTHCLTQNLSILSLIVIFIAVSVAPANALAFEQVLSHSPSQELTAHINLQGRGADVSFASLAIAAPSDPITTAGKWEKKKLAQAHYRVPRDHNPSIKNPVVLEGTASFYSREGCIGCNALRIMANGQPLNDHALTMAIGADNKHLVGYKAKVTSVATGKSVEVTITDTGGFHSAQYGNRVADLTIASKEAIGMQGGLGTVRVEIY